MTRWPWFLGGTRSSDAARALQLEREAHAAVEAQERDSPFVRGQRDLARDASALRLGRVDPGGADFRVLVADLLRHLLILGETGAGKSVLLLIMMLHVLLHGIGVVFLDKKGEMAALLRESLLPRVLAGMSSSKRRAFLATFRIIDPFGSMYLPPFNVLARDTSIAVEVQALDVASSLEAAIDAGSGVRMDTILDWSLRLLIQTPGATLLTLRRMLQEPALLDAIVQRCSDPDVRGYFLLRFPQEPAASRLAILARLDRFLALPQTRLCLSAPNTLDFDAMLGGGLTIIDLGRAPAGQNEVASFWATITGTKITRAIYRRPPTGNLRPAVVCIDEWQTALTPVMAASIEDVLARARSRSVSLWLANQQLAQLSGVSSSLREIALGQTTLQVLFRAAAEDARALRGMLPATGRVRRPASGDIGPQRRGYLSREEELELRAAEVTRLPDRTAYFLDKRKSWPAVRFRTATVDLSRAAVDPALAAELERGAVALPVTALEQAKAAHDRACDALVRPQRAAGPLMAPTTPPKKRRGRGPAGGLP